MGLVTMREVLAMAKAERQAIPAFNIDTVEIAQAILELCEERGEPVILAVGQGAIRDGKLELLAGITRCLAVKMKTPVVLHLDHGQSIRQVIQALCCGYTSVMIDGSSLPLMENIAVTRQTVEVAAAAGASVEAELGVILGKEDDIAPDDPQHFLVQAEDVKKFCAAVTVDALAVGIGNAHGFYKGKPQLNFERLREINEICDVPLVLHGGSGIPEEMIFRAIENGIRKINVATEVRHAYVTGMRSAQANSEYYEMVSAGKKAVKALAASKMDTFFRKGSDAVNLPLDKGEHI